MNAGLFTWTTVGVVNSPKRGHEEAIVRWPERTSVSTSMRRTSARHFHRGSRRLGEIRDRSFEQQRYRASGLTLVTAAIVLWNTVYIERAIDASARNGQFLNAELLKYPTWP